MFLQGIPETMPDEHYRPINIHGILNLSFFIAFAAILIILGVSFLLRVKKQEDEAAKRIKIAFGLFGVLYGICRIFFILMFQDFTNPAQNYDLFANIAYSFGMLGLTSIIWAIEKVKYETRYFFLTGLAITIITTAGIVLNLLGMAVIRELILIIIMSGTPVAGFFIIILYIQVIRLSSGEVRKKALYSLIGFLIMVVGITMDGQFFLAIETIPIWFKMDVVPLFCIVGYLMFAINQL
ncbi:MAG: hypothetical protein HWN67_23255 [Candidatus Helarchaeota archaeon]|nr:hypothetical protein [Candidatus Helarchaeota archaeon]